MILIILCILLFVIKKTDYILSKNDCQKSYQKHKIYDNDK